MDSALLDTDVFSFFFKADSRREAYLPDVTGRTLVSRSCRSPNSNNGRFSETGERAGAHVSESRSAGTLSCHPTMP